MGVALAVVVGGGALVVREIAEDGTSVAVASTAECDDLIEVNLATVPELQPQIQAAADASRARGGANACVTFKVGTANPSVVADQLASGAPDRPDLWVPDSSRWVARADDGNGPLTVAVPSLVSTPLVAVGPDRAFAKTDSWLDLFANTEPALLDPLTDSAGAEALFAVQAERAKTSSSDAEIARILVPVAQRHGSLAKPYSDPDGLFSQVTATNSVVIPATEQRFIAYKTRRAESNLRAVVPGTGTLNLDYPLVVTTKKNKATVSKAAALLATELRSEPATTALDAAGFRSPAGDPLGGGRGVGNITPLAKPQAAVADKALKQWAKIARPTRSLTVIDASSSMSTKVGDRTWMDLTVQAAETGIELIPDESQLGLWALSTRLSGGARDWAPLVPIRPLRARVGGEAQRAVIQRALGSLKSQVGESTGLYASSIAAYKAVQSSYDPAAVNTVTIFTDGFSADSGDITLAETISELRKLRDPGRPVRLIAIGMGPNVDGAALDKLARSTGGRSYVARDSQGIEKAFSEALQTY